MKVTFLGTNGWYDTARANTVCALAEGKNFYLILDAGGGLYRLKDLIREDKPVYMLLTHLHMDHIYGLSILPLFAWKQGLTFIVPDNLMEDLKNIFRLPYMPPPQKLKMPVEIKKLSEAAGLPFEVSAKPLKHAVETFGFRISAEGKTLVFGLDSGPCQNLNQIASGADLFITECSFLPEQAPHAMHLNPQQAALAAKNAGAKKLALTHFKADDYPSAEQRQAALQAALRIFTPVFAPQDGDVLEF